MRVKGSSGAWEHLRHAGFQQRLLWSILGSAFRVSNADRANTIGIPACQTNRVRLRGEPTEDVVDMVNRQALNARGLLASVKLDMTAAAAVTMLTALLRCRVSELPHPSEQGMVGEAWVWCFPMKPVTRFPFLMACLHAPDAKEEIAQH